MTAREKLPALFVSVFAFGILHSAFCIATPAAAYIQDGLVACWDGVENAGTGVHDAGATVWKDLVAGREFTLTDVTVNDNCMTFAGAKASYGSLSAADTEAVFLPATNGTVEVVFARSTPPAGATSRPPSTAPPTSGSHAPKAPGASTRPPPASASTSSSATARTTRTCRRSSFCSRTIAESVRMRR